MATGYNISYIKKARTCYALVMLRSDSGYCDVYAEYPNGSELFTSRVNCGAGTHTTANHGSGATLTTSDIVPICVCSGYAGATKIRFRLQKGTFFLMGLA